MHITNKDRRNYHDIQRGVEICDAIGYTKMVCDFTIAHEETITRILNLKHNHTEAERKAAIYTWAGRVHYRFSDDGKYQYVPVGAMGWDMLERLEFHRWQRLSAPFQLHLSL